MDESKEQIDLGTPDGILHTMNRDMKQQNVDPKDTEERKLERSIKTNLNAFIGMASLWATREKMGKTHLVEDLMTKGFNKMKELYPNEINETDQVLNNMLKDESTKAQQGIKPIMTPLIEKYRTILHEENK